MTANDTRYDIGDTYQLLLDTTQPTVPPTRVDAATVTVNVTAPDGTVATGSLAGGEVDHTGTGAYAYQNVTTQLGTYMYSWVATGTLLTKPWTVTESSQFTVAAPGLRLISLAEAKKALRYPDDDAGADDDEISEMIDSVTATIESFTGPVVPRDVTQRIKARCGILQQWPVISLTTIDGNVDTSAITFDDPAAQNIGAYESTLTAPVTLVYKVGRNPTPVVIRQAARELVRYWWQGSRQRSMMTPGTIRTTDDYSARSVTPGQEYGFPFAFLDKLRDFRRLKDAR